MDSAAVAGRSSADVTIDAKRDRLVILASTLGTVFEWYDFFIYGTLAAIIGKQFFPLEPDALSSCSRWRPSASASASGPLGAVAVRLSRRPARAQIHLPRHRHPDGPGDRRRRPRARAIARSASPRRSSSSACASCRGWRSAANMAARRSTSPSMRRRTSAGFYTSFIQAGVIGGFLLSLVVVLVSEGVRRQGRLGQLGLARAVPLLAAAARGVAVDAAEADGEPGVPGDEGRRRDRAQSDRREAFRPRKQRQAGRWSRCSASPPG